jgi:hypothetical protein
LRYNATPSLVLSMGVSYDNNHAWLIRPGISLATVGHSDSFVIEWRDQILEPALVKRLGMRRDDPDDWRLRGANPALSE